MPTLACINEIDIYKSALTIQHSFISSTLKLDLLADHLCPMNKTLLNLYSVIPLNLNHRTLFNDLQSNDLFQFIDPIACHYFIRGIGYDQLYDHHLYNFNIHTSADFISTYLREQYGTKVFLSANSWIDKYDHMSLIAGLINDNNYSLNFFRNLVDKMKKTNYKLISKRWQENDFDEQMFEQLINDIDQLYERYQLNKI